MNSLIFSKLISITISAIEAIIPPSSILSHLGSRAEVRKDLFNRVKQDQEVVLNRDTIDKIYFYYSNGFLEIGKDGYELKEYQEMPGGVWKHQMLNRNFETIPSRF